MSDDEIVNAIQAVGILVGGTLLVSAVSSVCPPLAALGKVVPMAAQEVGKVGLIGLLKQL